MTLLTENNFTGQAQRWATYGLVDPPDGANDFVFNTGSQQFNPISFMIQSFTGSSGFGNFAVTGALTSPNSQTLTVSEGSAIYGTGISTFTLSKFVIDGSDRGIDFQHNVNRQVGGAFSLTGLSAGSIDVVAESISTSYTLTNTRVEILEAGSPPVTSNNFLIMF
jgi:hypothetical protein